MEPNSYDRVLREIAIAEVNDQLEFSIEQIGNYGDLSDFPISYYCECSNGACASRIELTAQQRSSYKQGTGYFIVISDHEDPALEVVRVAHNGYRVVEKYLK